MRHHIRKFFSREDGRLRLFLVENALAELEKIKVRLETLSKGIRFYGSSILIIFCADSSDRLEKGEEVRELIV